MADILTALSIIGICTTILIIGKWVKELIMHNKQANLKANLKDGTIEFGNNKANIEKPIENQNKIVSNAFESPKELAVLESKNNNEIPNNKFDDIKKFNKKNRNLFIKEIYQIRLFKTILSDFILQNKVFRNWLRNIYDYIVVFYGITFL